ncbi:MAG: zinc dependent phospholipase C family protein [Candidatus Electronema sp. VV]
MAGGYTHITLAQLAVEEAQRRTELLAEEHRQALGLWKKFVIIGSMGPDYPYLDVADTTSAAWAAAMHSPQALDFIREAARRVRALPVPAVRQKCAAWLFGFAAHCVTDGVVHPVVNEKVGPYEQNKAEHRRCEMSQDVLVHAKLNLGAIELNRQLSVNIAQTTESGSRSKIDRDIRLLWHGALNAVWRSGQQESSRLQDWLRHWFGGGSATGLPAPTADEWHRAMQRLLKLAENGGRLSPFARHAAASVGLTYPEQPEPQYILGLDVPGGGKMDFEDIFAKAAEQIAAFWGGLSLSLQGRPSSLDSMAGWGLDDGLNDKNNHVFWS